MRHRRIRLGAAVAIAAAVSIWLGTVAGPSQAEEKQFRAGLTGYEEVPAVSTGARGVFTARVAQDAQSIAYELTYSGLESPATAAHIHFGQRGVAGGVIAFLCGGGGKPACPATGGTVTGTITAADVTGPAGQGIAAGQIAEVIGALRAGVVYANVHSTTFGGGEIRGQVRKGKGKD